MPPGPGAGRVVPALTGGRSVARGWTSPAEHEGGLECPTTPDVTTTQPRATRSVDARARPPHPAAHPERSAEPERRGHASPVREGRARHAGAPPASPGDLRRGSAGPGGGVARGGDPDGGALRPPGPERARAATEVDPVDQRRGREDGAAPPAGRRAHQRERGAYPQGRRVRDDRPPDAEPRGAALHHATEGAPLGPDLHDPDRGADGRARRSWPDRRGGCPARAPFRHARARGAAKRASAPMGPPD